MTDSKKSPPDISQKGQSRGLPQNQDQKWAPAITRKSGTRSGTMVQITLNAVLAALAHGEPHILCTQQLFKTQNAPLENKLEGVKPETDKREADSVAEKLISALPYGVFDPHHHRTFEIGIRDWVSRQTRVALGYVEQLYTFGDRGRERGVGDQLEIGDNHVISVGYLALAQKLAPVKVDDARWRDWYLFFPWEDWRKGEPKNLSADILPALKRWCGDVHDPSESDLRLQRIKIAFGYGEIGWEEERILERYELMYEAGLVAEAHHNDEGGNSCGPLLETSISGLAMASDHRRIVATAISRLRGKLKYRPVIFEMMGDEFTLLHLQKSVEAIIGFQTHKQNFRRSVESTGLVLRTGNVSSEMGGRPAALFKVNRSALKDRAASRLVLPRLKQSPVFTL